MATTVTSSTTTPASVGEELFLVHLRRESAASDAEIYKHAALVGQELWKIHCQRSGNSEEEYEQEEATTKEGNKKKKEVKKAKKPLAKPAAAQTRYNLRSKDRAVTKKRE